MLIHTRTASCCLSASVLQPSVIQEVLQGMKTRSFPVWLFISHGTFPIPAGSLGKRWLLGNWNPQAQSLIATFCQKPQSSWVLCGVPLPRGLAEHPSAAAVLGAIHNCCNTSISWKLLLQQAGTQVHAAPWPQHSALQRVRHAQSVIAATVPAPHDEVQQRVCGQVQPHVTFC